MKINKLLACLGLSVVCFTAASPVYAAVAGHVQFVNGDVQVTNTAGQSRPAQKGDAINEGDTLTSAQKSSAQIKMQDGGFVAVREDTRLKFDQFVFAGKEDGSEKGFFSLFKGGFRAVTGLIGRINKQNYRITTPAATIGIRGTDHETFVIAPGSPLAQMAPTGAYNKVNVGETSMTTDKGTIFVQPNQMGFAGGMNQMPQLQPVNTNVFTVGEAPAPGAKVEKKEEKEEKAGAKQEEKAAKSGKEEGKKEEAKAEAAEGGAAGEEAPVRETAVVDAAAPSTGGAPTAATSTIAATTTAEIIAPPTGLQVQTTTTLTAGGTTLNLVSGTGTTAGGQVITPGVTPAPAPVPVATAPYVQSDLAMALVTNSSSYLSPFVQMGTLIAKPADLNNALPNPSYIDRYAGKDVNSYVTYALNGTTTVGQATTTLANGIQFGRWDSTSAQWTAVGNTNCCAWPSPSNTPVYSHWAGGPAVNPVYLPEVLLGTATYTLAGGTAPTITTVTTPPAVSLSSASLSVNFTQQLVTFNLALSVGGTPWTASASGAPLQMMYWNGAKTGFRASTNFAAMTGWAPLTVTGATGGDVIGQLTGNGLDGAIMSYVLSGSVGAAAQVSGVAAFTSTAQNTATPYRIAALSTIDTIPAGQTNAGMTVPTERGGYNNAASVQFDVAGNAIQFNADKPFSNGSANTINIGTATPVGLGTDPVSGISWGRWQGGNLAITDLATNTTANPTNVNSHWITGPTMTGPVDLPVSGTFNYVLAGGTAPTDSLGGVGTLNSASLTANFTAQTVAVSLDVTTPNAGNLVASGANIPIEQKSFFNAGTANAPNGGANLGSLTVTCPATCPGAVLSGHLGGVFVGAGGIGAGVAYGMQKDTVIVNGVAAFHR
ncbi:FecR domain-containing protein [Candidatus Ferrigenium straubiae]|jgi:hypothetical protein|uniref:FecR domain-containing protein n=1 Tax=Candidatus Ferrigenium straubiae TaxID=2919506 RepID=UPI003F4AB1EE